MQLLYLLMERGLLKGGEDVEQAKFSAARQRVTFDDLRKKDEICQKHFEAMPKAIGKEEEAALQE